MSIEVIGSFKKEIQAAWPQLVKTCGFRSTDFFTREIPSEIQDFFRAYDEAFGTSQRRHKEDPWSYFQSAKGKQADASVWDWHTDRGWRGSGDIAVCAYPTSTEFLVPKYRRITEEAISTTLMNLPSDDVQSQVEEWLRVGTVRIHRPARGAVVRMSKRDFHRMPPFANRRNRLVLRAMVLPSDPTA